MSDITRDDLRVIRHTRSVYGHVDWMPVEITDKEFDRLAREQGYIRYSEATDDQ